MKNKVPNVVTSSFLYVPILSLANYRLNSNSLNIKYWKDILWQVEFPHQDALMNYHKIHLLLTYSILSKRQARFNSEKII